MEEQKIDEKKNDDLFCMSSRYGALDATVLKEFDSLFSLKDKKIYIRRGSFPVVHHIHATAAMHLLGVQPDNLIPWLKEYKASDLVNTPEFYLKNNPNVDVFGNYKVSWDELTDKNNPSKYLGTQTNFYGIREMFENDLKNNYNSFETEIENIYDMLSDRYEFLSNGLIGIAVHSPIQIGYSIAINHCQGVIDGLAQSVYAEESVPRC